MSNATQEFSRFKQLADADAEKSPWVTVVDCAQGGQTMARWADPKAPCWTQFIAKFASDSRIGHAHYHLGVCQLQTARPEAAETFRRVLSQFP